MQNAQQRARELAEAIGQSIGACYEISDFTTSTQGVYRKNMLMSTAMDAVVAEAEPDVEFEQIEINYNVSAKFYLNVK